MVIFVSKIDMESEKRWFAIPLEPHQRFMATFKVVSARMKISPMTLMYLLIRKENAETFSAERVFGKPMTFNETNINQIKSYFKEVYDKEEELVHFLNKEITTKYFIRPTNRTFKRTTRKQDRVTAKEVDNLLEAVFANLTL